jgi:hypothetical protein
MVVWWHRIWNLQMQNNGNHTSPQTRKKDGEISFGRSVSVSALVILSSIAEHQMRFRLCLECWRLLGVITATAFPRLSFQKFTLICSVWLTFTWPHGEELHRPVNKPVSTGSTKIFFQNTNLTSCYNHSNKGFILCTLQVILLLNSEYLSSLFQYQNLKSETGYTVLLDVIFLHYCTCPSN